MSPKTPRRRTLEEIAHELAERTAWMPADIREQPILVALREAADARDAEWRERHQQHCAVIESGGECEFL